jgi:hypothetical protein
MNDIRSLFTPTTPENARDTPLKEGDDAPAIKGVKFEKPTVVAFLRHIGCPFAEKTFLELRKFAEKHGDGYEYIAIINGSETDTENYIREVGGPGKIHVLPDPDREVYGRWVPPSVPLFPNLTEGCRTSWMGPCVWLANIVFGVESCAGGGD